MMEFPTLEQKPKTRKEKEKTQNKIMIEKMIDKRKREIKALETLQNDT